jgi:beta-glucanase (GH16 family)
VAEIPGARDITAEPLAAAQCPKGYKLAWGDEFDSAATSFTKWNYELFNGCQYGICGWGNNELEWYTNRTDNANVALGKLVISARATTESERAGCCGDKPCKSGECAFTSARLRTYGKYSVAPNWQSGSKTVRIAVRMKFPVGKGLWPAFSLLPENSPANCSGCGAYGPWPSSGAITIGQSINDMKNATGGIVYGGAFPNSVFSNYVAKLKNNEDYHEYVLEWSRRGMKWLLDGKVVHTALSGQGGTVPGGWFSSGPGAGPDSPFDKPFYMIVNMAVGGTYTGSPTKSQLAETLKKPKSMQVDYIRVCQK